MGRLSTSSRSVYVGQLGNLPRDRRRARYPKACLGPIVQHDALVNSRAASDLFQFDVFIDGVRLLDISWTKHNGRASLWHPGCIAAVGRRVHLQVIRDFLLAKLQYQTRERIIDSRAEGGSKTLKRPMLRVEIELIDRIDNLLRRSLGVHAGSRPKVDRAAAFARQSVPGLASLNHRHNQSWRGNESRLM